jgi:hypothetical protein
LIGVVAKEITLINRKLTTRIFKELYTDRAVVALPCANNTVFSENTEAVRVIT